MNLGSLFSCCTNFTAVINFQDKNNESFFFFKKINNGRKLPLLILVKVSCCTLQCIELKCIEFRVR